MAHEPVLLPQVLAGLALQPGEIVVDATVNRGGHSLAFCRAIGSTGRLIGLDADGGALAEAEIKLKVCPCPVGLVAGNFRKLDLELEKLGLPLVDVVFFDLGLSSEQLDDHGRGFSFQGEAPLGMTLAREPETGALTAGQIVNHWSEQTLADIIYAFGEEVFARKIAAAIVATRQLAPIKTTAELVEIIRMAVTPRYARGRRHFATKTFQALRIVVNDELMALREGLAAAWSHLALGGRLAVISFHSLEARIVKEFFRQATQAGTGQLLTKHAVRPTYQETRENPRARSAQLRILKKI